MENSITSSPKFKVGQVWRTRNGEAANIEKVETEDTKYPILSISRAGPHWHYPNGRSCLYSAECDLVELLKDVTSTDEVSIPKTIVLTQVEGKFMEYPVKPPPALIEKWRDEALNSFSDDECPCPCDIDDARDEYIATQAACWAADQELEACEEFLHTEGVPGYACQLRAARRPQPPSLKQQAKEVLDQLQALRQIGALDCDIDVIRKLIEASPENL